MTRTLDAAAAIRTPRPVGTVLVTGAASGLGRAVAGAVLAAGGRPLLLDRHDSRDGLDGAASSPPPPPRSPTSPTPGRPSGPWPSSPTRADGLDGVVTAAGTDACGRLEDVPGAEWDRVVQVNLLGTAAVIRGALPGLRRSRGRIVTVASTLGLRALSDASAYCASKFGVIGLSRALAAELAGEVGLTTLIPGGMNTAFFDGRTEQYRPGPDARLNDPADVADAVLFALTRPDGCEVRELRGLPLDRAVLAVTGAMRAPSNPPGPRPPRWPAHRRPRPPGAGARRRPAGQLADRPGPPARPGRPGAGRGAARPRSAPGGAANVAANLAALGATVELLSVVGDDRDGATLLDALARAPGRGGPRGAGSATPAHAGQAPAGHCGTDGGPVRRRARPAGPRPLRGHALVDALRAAVNRGDLDAVVVADYDLGVLTGPVRDAAGGEPAPAPAAGRGRPRAGRLVRAAPPTWSPRAWPRPPPRWASRHAAGGADRLDGGRPAGTRWCAGWAGRTCCSPWTSTASLLLPAGDGPVRHAPAAHRAAGLGGLRGRRHVHRGRHAGPLRRRRRRTPALALAQAAADVVTARPGTAVCDTAALTARLAHADRGQVLAHRDLLATVAEHRRQRHRVVFTNGCFDVLHRGHVAYLRQARALGDVLIVALNGDASVRRLKGPQRPVNPLVDRAGVVGALDCVDLVTSFDEDSPVALLEQVRPDVYAKGGDYTPQMLPETPVVERLGGQVRVLDYLSDHSTTAIVDRIRAHEPAPFGERA